MVDPRIVRDVSEKCTSSVSLMRLQIFWVSKYTSFDTIYLRNGLTDLAQILQNFTVFYLLWISVKFATDRSTRSWDIRCQSWCIFEVTKSVVLSKKRRTYLKSHFRIFRCSKIDCQMIFLIICHFFSYKYLGLYENNTVFKYMSKKHILRPFWRRFIPF